MTPAIPGTTKQEAWPTIRVDFSHGKVDDLFASAWQVTKGLTATCGVGIVTEFMFNGQLCRVYPHGTGTMTGIPGGHWDVENGFIWVRS